MKRLFLMLFALGSAVSLMAETGVWGGSTASQSLIRYDWDTTGCWVDGYVPVNGDDVDFSFWPGTGQNRLYLECVDLASKKGHTFGTLSGTYGRGIRWDGRGSDSSYVLSIADPCGWLGWFDLYGIVGRYHQQLSAGGKFLDMANHMVLPVLTLTMLNTGGLTRYTRTNMLEGLNADYIRTARAKGLDERTVINRHAFRNTLIPLVSYMSYLIPSLFSGSMITETLFQIPGIGYISYDAMVAGDLPFTMFYSVFILILTQLSLMLADIMYAVVDPRVRVN